MKYKNIVILLIYILLSVFIVIKNILDNIYLDFFISLIIFIISYVDLKDSFIRIKDKYGKIQTLLIASIAYMIFYYLLGLLFSFEYSPYSRNFTSIINNFIFLILPIIFQEYIRYSLINKSYTKINSILIILLFILLNINLNNPFENIFIIFEQIILTFIAKKCSFRALLAYILPLQISYIIAPIFPKIDLILLNIINVIYYIITYLLINNEYVELKAKSKAKYSIVFTLIFVLLICFVLGIFSYKPLTIMSDSMYPIFSRGDLVIIKKKNVQKFEVGDIIVYKIDKSRVVHRIVEIVECDDSICFITKGDNNNSVDTRYVKKSQVLGVVKLVIPKIGYPTVWLNELFN